jgi:hypothetical protein
MITFRINQKWFKEIQSGAKREEYREISIHNTRLLTSPNGKASQTLRFINGYKKGTPADSVLFVEYLGYHVGLPNPEWCDPEMVGKQCYVYVIRLGRMLERPLVRCGVRKMKQTTLFPKPHKPRQVLMHVSEIGIDVARFSCKCGFESDWLIATETEIRRGIPCPVCNGLPIEDYADVEDLTN